MIDQKTQATEEIKKAEQQVRENEDASLQDDSYTYDSDNTGNEDIHDVSDFESDPEENFEQ